MTIREALDQKRKERKDDCTGLVLCKGELFYLPQVGHLPEHTVYPVRLEWAQREAEFFDVLVTKE